MDYLLSKTISGYIDNIIEKYISAVPDFILIKNLITHMMPNLHDSLIFIIDISRCCQGGYT